VKIDARTKTRALDCSSPVRQGADISADAFLDLVLRSTLPARDVALTIAREPDGSWVALTADVYGSVYCD
jgi:hypothetical protein